MDTLHNLLLGFGVALTPAAILACFVGCILGMLIGVLPGVGTATTIAILLPFAFGQDPTLLLITFSGIYLGAQFGGANTSILVNMPGEASSVATALDGYPLACRGKAGTALAVAAVASFTGGLLGLIALSFFAPIISHAALVFGPPEKFILTTFVLVLFCSLGANRYAIVSMLLGLMLGTVGPDPLRGEPRYDFGLFALTSGLDFIVVAIGLLGVGEVLASWDSRTPRVESTGWRSALPRWSEISPAFGTMIRSGFVGFGVGVLPGAGTAAASFMAYTLEKRLSKFGQEFGTGRIEGVAAPESANNAAVAGALVPMLTLGIPGSASTALMLAALVVAGVQPGPLLFSEHPALVWGAIASLFIANVVLIFLSIFMIPLFVKVSSIEYVYIFPVIILFAVIGAYSVNGDMFEVWLMIGFGVAGYLCKRVGIPLAPMILGLVLGPLTETSLTQSMAMSRGSAMIFLERPVSLSLIIVSLTPFVVIAVRRILAHRVAAVPPDAKKGKLPG